MTRRLFNVVCGPCFFKVDSYSSYQHPKALTPSAPLAWLHAEAAGWGEKWDANVNLNHSFYGTLINPTWGMSNVVPGAVNFAYQCNFWLNRCWRVAIRTITWPGLSAVKSAQMFSISSPSHSSLLRLILPPVLSHSISPCWIRLNLNELYSPREGKETYQLLNRLGYITTRRITAIHLSSANMGRS